MSVKCKQARRASMYLYHLYFSTVHYLCSSSVCRDAWQPAHAGSDGCSRCLQCTWATLPGPRPLRTCASCSAPTVRLRCVSGPLEQASSYADVISPSWQLPHPGLFVASFRMPSSLRTVRVAGLVALPL